MNVEANRLATFAAWPSHCPIEVSRIARGGFFATGRAQEAECHWCRQRISDWRYGDQVMTRHRQLDPLCPFITDPMQSGNVPTLENAATAPPPTAPSNANNADDNDDDDDNDVQSRPSQLLQEIEEPDNRGDRAAPNGDVGPDYMNEQCRLDTFTNWPITCVTPGSLARAGFYYYNQSDHVRCAWCQGVIAEWVQGDDPFVEHSKFFPSCPRAICGPNVRLLAGNDAPASSGGVGSSNGVGGAGAAASIAAIGIQPHQPSAHDEFASLDVRLQSFQTWPPDAVQRPDALAAAGFFYLDADDSVRCFHCSGGLRSWKPYDDPWHEHAKYFPLCGFVELVRGRSYVRKVHAGVRPTLAAAMAGEWPRKALQMGFAVSDVRHVVEQRLALTNAPFEGIDGLVVAILSLKVASAEMGVEAQAAEVTMAAPAPAPVEHSAPSTPEDGAAGGAVGGGTSPAAASTNGVANSADGSPVEGSGESALKAILSGTVNNGRPVNLEDENRKLKDAMLCKVCMAEEVGIVFLPCGHLVSCVQCASSVTACPLCRTTIKAYVRTYLS